MKEILHNVEAIAPTPAEHWASKKKWKVVNGKSVRAARIRDLRHGVGLYIIARWAYPGPSCFGNHGVILSVMCF